MDPAAPGSGWFVDVNGRKIGPFTTDEVRGLYRDGEIPKGTQITAEHLAGLWLPVEDALEPKTPATSAPPLVTEAMPADAFIADEPTQSNEPVTAEIERPEPTLALEPEAPKAAPAPTPAPTPTPTPTPTTGTGAVAAGPATTARKPFRPPPRPENLDPPVRSHGLIRPVRAAHKPAPHATAAIHDGPGGGTESHPPMDVSVQDAPTDPGLSAGAPTDAPDGADEADLIRELQEALLVAKKKNAAREASSEKTNPLMERPKDWKQQLRELAGDRKIQMAAGVGIVALISGILVARWWSGRSTTPAVQEPPRRRVITEPRPPEPAPPPAPAPGNPQAVPAPSPGAPAPGNVVPPPRSFPPQPRRMDTGGAENPQIPPPADPRQANPFEAVPPPPAVPPADLEDDDDDDEGLVQPGVPPAGAGDDAPLPQSD
ncbi:MAG TPA: DUF4339 domain-containing protein [Bdellovibrionota bacterium]|nr:DUF4339 domain-containing protein [Bdellovibrionota bacterium]